MELYPRATPERQGFDASPRLVSPRYASSSFTYHFGILRCDEGGVYVASTAGRRSCIEAETFHDEEHEATYLLSKTGSRIYVDSNGLYIIDDESKKQYSANHVFQCRDARTQVVTAIDIRYTIGRDNLEDATTEICDATTKALSWVGDSMSVLEIIQTVHDYLVRTIVNVATGSLFEGCAATNRMAVHHGDLLYCYVNDAFVRGFYELDGELRFFDQDDSHMVRGGRRQVGGYWYYFEPETDAMATGRVMIDGKTRVFDSKDALFGWDPRTRSTACVWSTALHLVRAAHPMWASRGELRP